MKQSYGNTKGHAVHYGIKHHVVCDLHKLLASVHVEDLALGCFCHCGGGMCVNWWIKIS